MHFAVDQGRLGIPPGHPAKTLGRRTCGVSWLLDGLVHLRGRGGFDRARNGQLGARMTCFHTSLSFGHAGEQLGNKQVFVGALLGVGWGGGAFWPWLVLGWVGAAPWASREGAMKPRLLPAFHGSHTPVGPRGAGN